MSAGRTCAFHLAHCNRSSLSPTSTAAPLHSVSVICIPAASQEKRSITLGAMQGNGQLFLSLRTPRCRHRPLPSIDILAQRSCTRLIGTGEAVLDSPAPDLIIYSFIGANRPIRGIWWDSAGCETRTYCIYIRARAGSARAAKQLNWEEEKRSRRQVWE